MNNKVLLECFSMHLDLTQNVDVKPVPRSVEISALSLHAVQKWVLVLQHTDPFRKVVLGLALGLREPRISVVTPQVFPANDQGCLHHSSYQIQKL